MRPSPLFKMVGVISPLKNPTRRVGGTKPEALVPPALRVGFLRGVIRSERREASEKISPKDEVGIWVRMRSENISSQSDQQALRNSGDALSHVYYIKDDFLFSYFPKLNHFRI